jgi:redox-sensing transcriptional repressor
MSMRDQAFCVSRDDSLMTSAGDVSPLTLNRLSIYLRCLRSLRDSDIDRVSSQELADRFQLSAAQIRKDLAHFGEFGIRGVGYDVEQLTERLRGLLGLDRRHPTLVVGVGNLGSALVRFLAMGESAFQVVAAVDNNPKLIGRKIGSVIVEDSDDLPGIVKSSGAEIGVLTVPARSAQSNYNALVAAGISAVLNFAPIRLERQKTVLTRSVDLRIFFEELGFLLRSKARTS